MRTADSLEKSLILGKIEGRRRRGCQRMRWLNGIIDAMNLSLAKLREMVMNRDAWHAAVHGVAKSWTWLSDWTVTISKDWKGPLSGGSSGFISHPRHHPLNAIRDGNPGRGVCNFLGCLASAKIWNGRPVLQLGYSSAFFGKQRKVYSQCVRVGWPQRRGLDLSWLPPFIHLSPPHPLSLPYANLTGQEGHVFVSPEVLPSSLMDFLLFLCSFSFVQAILSFVF